LSLAGRSVEAHSAVTAIRRTRPHYRVNDFLSAFRFSPDAAALFRQSAARIGMA